MGVNGSGMHTNVSISENGKNLFWDAKGEEASKMDGHFSTASSPMATTYRLLLI